MNNGNKWPKYWTKRHLVYYEKMLGFSRELLGWKIVLDLWSWLYDLQKDLEELWIDSRVINLDMRDNVQNEWVVADMTEPLEFDDDYFDVVLSLWSLYQIDPTDRLGVLKEAMRVAKAIHIWPVYQDDIDIMQELCEEMNYEVILCQHQKYGWHSYWEHLVWLIHLSLAEKIRPWISKFQKEAHYIISSDEDYNTYRDSQIQDRIIDTKQRAMEQVLWWLIKKQWDARLCILKKKNL